MDDQAVRALARKRLENNSVEVEVESDARVIRLDDPESSGYAVEAWIYLMDSES